MKKSSKILFLLAIHFSGALSGIAWAGENDQLVPKWQNQVSGSSLQPNDKFVRKMFNLVKSRTQRILDALNWYSSPNMDPSAQDKDGWTLGMFAARYGQPEVALKIASHPKFDPNLQNKNGSTLGMFAASYGQPELALKIASHPKFDPNLQDEEGWTLGMIAARYGQPEVALKIASHPKFDPNLQNKDGWTLGMFAARYGQPELALKIASHPKFDPNAQDEEGWTLGMIAARYGQPELALKIASHPKFDPNLQNKNGWTLGMVAAEYGQPEVAVSMLLNPTWDGSGDSKIIENLIKFGSRQISKDFDFGKVDFKELEKASWVPPYEKNKDTYTLWHKLFSECSSAFFKSIQKSLEPYLKLAQESENTGFAEAALTMIPVDQINFASLKGKLSPEKNPSHRYFKKLYHYRELGFLPAYLKIKRELMEKSKDATEWLSTLHGLEDNPKIKLMISRLFMDYFPEIQRAFTNQGSQKQELIELIEKSLACEKAQSKRYELVRARLENF